jgi:hypothetical protein
MLRDNQGERFLKEHRNFLSQISEKSQFKIQPQIALQKLCFSKKKTI